MGEGGRGACRRKAYRKLLAKGWIEKRGTTANEVSYRLTDKGLAAKKMPVRVYS
jgi:DNA-binding transcriptional regulator PaaX